MKTISNYQLSTINYPLVNRFLITANFPELNVDIVSKKAIEFSHNWIRRQNILGNYQVLDATI